MNPAAIFAAINVTLLQRPLLRVETAQDCLNKSRREINAMIENGELPFAFDISTDQGRTKEPRIFTLCVAEKTGWKSPIGETKNFQLNDVLAMVLPKRDLRSTETARIFACSGDQIQKLAKLNFTVTRKPTATDGPNSYTVFSRASVARWLESRRII